MTQNVNNSLNGDCCVIRSCRNLVFTRIQYRLGNKSETAEFTIAANKLHSSWTKNIERTSTGIGLASAVAIGPLYQSSHLSKPLETPFSIDTPFSIFVRVELV
jgi:hypothetical protein